MITILKQATNIFLPHQIGANHQSSNPDPGNNIFLL